MTAWGAELFQKVTSLGWDSIQACRPDCTVLAVDDAAGSANDDTIGPTPRSQAKGATIGPSNDAIMGPKTKITARGRTDATVAGWMPTQSRRYPVPSPECRRSGRTPGASPCEPRSGAPLQPR